MCNKKILFLAMALLALSGCGRKVTVSHPTVVPEPVFMVEKEGAFSLSAIPKVSVVNVGQNSATVKFVMKTLRHARMHPKLVSTSQNNDIELVINDTVNTELGDEGYLVEVRASGIRLSANTETGLFYAAQTFMQLLPTDVVTTAYSTIVLPECTILDYPRFGWRGLQLDLSDGALSAKTLRRVVDMMANYKLNRLCVSGGRWSDDTLSWQIDTAMVYERAEVVSLIDYAAECGVRVLWDSTCVTGDDLRAGLDSARAGLHVAMSPVALWSLDRYQADPRYQPRAAEGLATLGSVYEFEPVPVGTNSHVAVNIIGGQARMRTAYATGQQQVEYMLLPRLLAVSECLWSPRDKKDWNRFRRKVEEEKERLGAKGYAYCEGSFTPCFTARRVDEHTMNITIGTEVPNTYIFYTTNMSTPTRQSAIYLGPVNLERGTHIKLLPVYKDVERDSVYEFVIK